MELIPGEYYYVTDAKDGFILFRFAGDYREGRMVSPYILCSIGDMNKHWGVTSTPFDRGDGKNTYPFEFKSKFHQQNRNWIDIRNREVRQATSAEVHWLESCAKSGMMLLKDEYRQYKLEQLVGYE